MFDIITKIRSPRELRIWYANNGIYRDRNNNIGNTYNHIGVLDQLVDENRDGWDIVFEELSEVTTDITPHEAEAFINAYEPALEATGDIND